MNTQKVYPSFPKSFKFRPNTKFDLRTENEGEDQVSLRLSIIFSRKRKVNISFLNTITIPEEVDIGSQRVVDRYVRDNLEIEYDTDESGDEIKIVFTCSLTKKGRVKNIFQGEVDLSDFEETDYVIKSDHPSLIRP